MKHSLLLCAALFLGLSVNAQVDLQRGLVACYPFSGNANDMTGNGHNGTVVGAALTADRFGNPLSAYIFNNTSSCYISVPNFSTILTSNDMSISFWSIATGNTSDQPFLATPDAETNRFGIAVNYTSVDVIWDYGDWISSGGRMAYYTPYSTLWQHWVFMVSQTQNVKKIFLNGVMVDSTTYPTGYNPAGTTLNIGGAVPWSGGWNGFPGSIDDIRIYNRAINNAEVLALYNATSAGISCTPEGVNDIEGSAPYIYSAGNGVVHMAFGKTAFKGTLQVYNMIGQKVDEKVMNASANTSEIYSMKNSAKGMYILVLNSGTSNYSFKFEL